MQFKMALATAAVALSTTCAYATNWTAYSYSAVPTTAAVKGMKQIDKRVAEETNGKLKITLHLGHTLQIKATDITEAVGDGVVQFGDDFFFSGSVPIARVLNLPMLISNAAEFQKAYAAMKPTLVKAFAKQGVVVLGSYLYPAQTIFTTFPMKSLSDLKGHKIRVTSPEQGAFVSAFGGDPITMTGSEVPTSLERGVIGGVLTASAGGAKNWHEFLPYNYRFPVNYVNSMVIANAQAFAALSPDEQHKLRAIVGSEVKTITANFEKDEVAQMSAQEKDGMKIEQPAPGDAKIAEKKMSAYWSKWAKQNGSRYEKALARVRKAIGK